MRLDSFVKLKHESSTGILFVGIRYSCVTYFLTSITMPDPDPQTGETVGLNNVNASCGISSL